MVVCRGWKVMVAHRLRPSELHRHWDPPLDLLDPEGTPHQRFPWAKS